MDLYSIHHAALRIDYLVQAYAQATPGAPYDPRGTPAELIADMWHYTAAQGMDRHAAQIDIGSWMRCVADMHAVEDRVRQGDPRLAARIGRGVHGIAWEQVCQVIESAGATGVSGPVPVPEAADHAWGRMRRFTRVLARWSDDAGCDPRMDLQAVLIRFRADVTHWALWMSLGHAAIGEEGRQRFRAHLLADGPPPGAEGRRAWEMLSAGNAIGTEEWAVLADGGTPLVIDAPLAPGASLAESLFG